MPHRLKSAIDRVEARRIELEQDIVSELEARFFSDPEPDVEIWVIHLGAGEAGPVDADGTATGCHSQFVTTWYAA